jgi:hypothetical protein
MLLNADRMPVSSVGKSKCKVIPRLIKHHVMKAYGGVEVQLSHSESWYQMEVSGQFYIPAALTLGKGPPVPINIRQRFCEPLWQQTAKSRTTQPSTFKLPTYQLKRDSNKIIPDKQILYNIKNIKYNIFSLIIYNRRIKLILRTPCPGLTNC